MQTNILNSLRTLIKPQKLISIEQSKYLNLPDLQFYNWCFQQYGLNKGVYNTIDSWFHEYGINHIQYRRIYLLAFLEFAKAKGIEQDKHKFIRFGNGGLIRKLNEFIEVYRIDSQSSYKSC